MIEAKNYRDYISQRSLLTCSGALHQDSMLLCSLLSKCMLLTEGLCDAFPIFLFVEDQLQHFKSVFGEHKLLNLSYMHF